MHIQQHIVRRKLLRSGIQVEVPLHIHMLRRPHPQPRDQRRNRPRLRQKRNPRKIQRRVEDVAPPIDHRSAKGLVEEVLLRQPPADQLAAAAHRPLRLRVAPPLLHETLPWSISGSRLPDLHASLFPCTAEPSPAAETASASPHTPAHSCRSQRRHRRTAAHSKNYRSPPHSDT